MMPSSPIPSSVNELITNRNGQISTFPFPPNLAAQAPRDLQEEIFRWMYQNYIFPQILGRSQFEEGWNELLDMARAAWKTDKINLDPKSRAKRALLERRLGSKNDPPSPSEKVEITDTIIFDAVDRLTNLSHFISFKERLPMQYIVPRYVRQPYANDVYQPIADLVRSGNALLEMNADQSDFYRGHLIALRHFFTYGVCYANSEFEQTILPKLRRRAESQGGGFGNQLELTKFRTTFEPISIRRLWLDWRLTTYNMEHQPCPFFFDAIPPFAITANPYHPQFNPFGFANLDDLKYQQTLFSEPATRALYDAFSQQYPNMSFETLMPAELQVGLRWTFFPMLPLDPQTGQFGEGVPLSRWIVQAFGQLHNAQITLLRLQPSFYEEGAFPLYGSAHMPDTDSGAYPPAIGTILKTHYRQIVTSLHQFLENKDWINDPPTDVVTGSPALNNDDFNKKGEKVEVAGLNDLKRREPYDGTQTTISFIADRREQAKTSSKAVDAVLGRAMGGRTSATEASNVFQTSMSGITTDVNIFNHDIAGGYGERVWSYMQWADPDILYHITGCFGFAIRPEHLSIRFELSIDAGSTFIESIVRQGNIRYLLESTVGDPAVNRPALLRALLREWKIGEVNEIVNDNGRESAILLAQEQAVRTLLGEPTFVGPDESHEIAIKVKSSILQDRNSVWMKNPESAPFIPMLIEQIKQHQYYLQLQQVQAMLAAMSGAGAGANGLNPNLLQQLQNQVSAPADPSALAGQSAQLSGGMVGT